MLQQQISTANAALASQRLDSVRTYCHMLVTIIHGTAPRSTINSQYSSAHRAVFSSSAARGTLIPSHQPATLVTAIQADALGNRSPQPDNNRCHTDSFATSLRRFNCQVVPDEYRQLRCPQHSTPCTRHLELLFSSVSHIRFDATNKITAVNNTAECQPPKLVNAVHCHAYVYIWLPFVQLANLPAAPTARTYHK